MLSLWLGVAAAQSGGGQLHTVPVKPLKKGVQLLPMLAPASSGAVRRVNAQLAKMNRQIKVDIRACSYWTRSVDTTMVSSRYVSFVVIDHYFCGGVHPSADTLSLVFDMHTGKAIDPSALVDDSADTKSWSDNTTTGGTVDGLILPGLLPVYLQKAEADCKDVYSDDQSFIVWPEATKTALVVQASGLPHVTQACEYPLELSLSEARSLGFKQSFLDAVEKAHRQGETRKR